jgi:predicted phosphodiesterase
MSRRAVISDVHGNLIALEAVLADIKTQSVDEIVCLGDIAGYGPQPKECIDLVRANCAWSLRGNHDEALFTDPVDFGKNALAAIFWQRTILQPKPDSPADVADRWNWLKNLPPEHNEKDVLFVHASPRDPLYEYVLREDFDDQGLGPTQKAKDIFSSMEWLCFCGHSHRPGVVAEDYKWIVPGDLDRGQYIIKRGYKTIVNIGSVGQPRDGINSACYVIFEYRPPDHTKTTQVAKPVESENTVVQVREASSANAKAEEDTRYGKDLQQARDTALLNMPKVIYRRVPYDIEEAQRRFRAVPELPENNALRLAKGL